MDLSGGSQPLSNEDGSLWVSFNGEIFNHVELRAQLEPLGHAFRTRSEDSLEGHERTRGSLHFYPARPLPAALVRRLIRTRLAET